MPIQNDWSIDYVNRRIYHSSGNTVYTVNALYSYLMDTFDELTQMDDSVPMTAQTPTEYTMVNGWFIDDESVKYLSNGAIKTSGYQSIIQVLTLNPSPSAYTPAVSGDIGKQVVDDGAQIGALLSYNNTLRKWWIRTATTILGASSMSISGGTGTGTAALSGCITGEDLYSNLYTLGTIETTPYPQVYIFQNGNRISEWSSLSNWDPGHIDVLIKVKEANILTDSGNLIVFARQYGDNYDHFPINVSTGGRNAVPLATSLDLNNATGSHYLMFNNLTQAFSTGTVIGATSLARAEILAVTQTASGGTLTLGNVVGVFQNGETLTGTPSGSAKVNGTLGDTYITFASKISPFTVGQILTGTTSTAKRIIRGIQDDGTTGKLVLQANLPYWQSTVYYTDYLAAEALTDTGGGSATASSTNPDDTSKSSITLTSGFGNILIGFVNGNINYVTETSVFTVGKMVSGGTSLAQGLIVGHTDTGGASGSLALANVVGTFVTGETIKEMYSTGAATTSGTLSAASTINKAFQQATAKPYNVIVDCNTRTLASLYQYLKYVSGEGSHFSMYPTYKSGGSTLRELLDGEEYLYAYRDVDTPTNTYTPVKAAPFGTFAGGTFFGARGIWVEDMAAADVQKYQLIDATGTTQTPPNQQSIVVTNLISGDRVSVFRTDGGGNIDKAMYTSHATSNSASGFTFTVNEAISTDTPSTGFLRLRKTTGIEERLPFTSWTGSVFTTSTAHTSGYGTGDTAYVPFIDDAASGASLSTTVIFVSNRNVVIRVRRYTTTAIIPFETTGVFGNQGLSVATIRNPDTIVQ